LNNDSLGYLDEDKWHWIQDHPDYIPEIWDSAASQLSFLIEEYEIRQALEDAIEEIAEYDN
jgi:hypothetical protein